MAQYDYLFKLLVVGDSGTGKTSLLLRYCDDQFTDSFLSTIGVDFRFRDVVYSSAGTGKKNVRLQIWDTAGQERFRHITSSFYRAAHGVIVCFDVSDRGSFEKVESWLKDISSLAPTSVSIMLVATKCDLSDERVVTEDEARTLAEEHSIPYLETSSRNGTNVDTGFTMLTKYVVERQTDAARNARATADAAATGNIRPDGRRVKRRSCWRWPW
jgi:Ras-related protein Rab-1A